MADPKIKESVGEQGKNNLEDVIIIQTLLNKLGDFPVVANGVCGSDTIAAIRAFQSEFLAQPDGRIDPGGRTFKRLVQITNLGLVLLPQECGLGYYSYSSFDKQYGTPATIKMLQEVAQSFYLNRPNLLIGIGDISFRNGAEMPPHQSHRTGRNIDIRPLRNDDAQRGVTIDDNNAYNREETRLLVESLLAHSNVKRILFNDRQIRGVTFYKGHHNHLHVETYT